MHSGLNTNISLHHCCLHTQSPELHLLLAHSISELHALLAQSLSRAASAACTLNNLSCIRGLHIQLPELYCTLTHQSCIRCSHHHHCRLQPRQLPTAEFDPPAFLPPQLIAALPGSPPAPLQINQSRFTHCSQLNYSSNHQRRSKFTKVSSPADAADAATTSAAPKPPTLLHPLQSPHMLTLPPPALFQIHQSRKFSKVS